MEDSELDGTIQLLDEYTRKTRHTYAVVRKHASNRARTLTLSTLAIVALAGFGTWYEMTGLRAKLAPTFTTFACVLLTLLLYAWMRFSLHATELMWDELTIAASILLRLSRRASMFIEHADLSHSDSLIVEIRLTEAEALLKTLPYRVISNTATDRESTEYD